MLKVVNEFKDFAMRGNVIDLAVGVIIGAAFAPIVGTMVDNIIMPPIGYLLAGIDFSSLAITLPTPTGDGVLIKYGLFLNALIKFLITAFAIFLVVKAINTMKRPAPGEPPAPPPTEQYLKEIRDLLAKRPRLNHALVHPATPRSLHSGRGVLMSAPAPPTSPPNPAVA